MRFAQARYVKPQPLVTKKSPAVTAHLNPPIKGMALQNKGTPGDPQTATLLKNFVIEDDRIEVRSGHRRILNLGVDMPVWHLVPHYGSGRLLAACDGKLIDIFSYDPGNPTGTPPVPPTPPIVVQPGFTGNDWHWTSFSNLGEEDYTVMVNGTDGVWSWNGGTVTDPGDAIVITKISKSTTGPPAGPCVVTVGAADIGKFRNGSTVVISGGIAPGMDKANGPHIISNVGNPANTFTLVGVDTSAASADQTTGTMRANPPGSIQKETIALPADATWINPNLFDKVLSHMNRLWFADSSNLAVYFLPIQQKSTEITTGVGRLRFIPLNVLFRRGGAIRALATWTIDGGQGMEDHLVIFSTNGEAVVYNGTDPESDFNLVGIFRFDSPMSKHSVINYGGDCWAFVSTGMVPLSTMLRAETDNLGQADRSVISTFLKEAVSNRSGVGWQAFLNPSTQRLFCNIPQVGGKYMQMVRHMPRPVWSEFSDIPARCWNWIDPMVYFGDDHGNVYEMHPMHKTDASWPDIGPQAIKVDVQFAWNQLKTSNVKQAKMVKVHIITDGQPVAYVDCMVDYEIKRARNLPEISTTSGGTKWDVAKWNEAPWAGGIVTINNWTGVSCKTGYTLAVRVTANIFNCTFGLAGIDVQYEIGAPM